MYLASRRKTYLALPAATGRFWPMRRTWWSRAFAALLVAWFTAYGVGPEVLHVCEMHSPMSAKAATQVTAHGDHHDPAQLGQPGDTGECCTCPGACALVAPATLPQGTQTLVVATIALPDTGLPSYEYVPVAAAHTLPFANGPPVRA